MNEFYYEIPPFRPPSEAYSLLFRATRNCSWRRCEFCGMYKGAKLEIRTVDEVKKDIITAKKLADTIREWADKSGQSDNISMIARLNGIPWLDAGVVKHVFIGDSNSPIMKTKELAEVVSFLYETFPHLERVTSYARAKTIFKKQPDELKTLRNAGLSRLHVGLETGDDELLSYINKGATSEEMIIAGKKAIDAGFELSEYVMPGLGGKERWEQHAINSAKVLNQINPHFIRLRTLDLNMAPNTPLCQKYNQGEFAKQSIEDLIIEVGTFIKNLDVTSQLVTSDFASNYYMENTDGRLPDDREKMLEALNIAMEWFRSKEESSILRQMRVTH